MAITNKERLKTIFELLQKPKTFRALLSLNHTGYLKDNGWFNSFERQIPIDSNSEPIPWTTYPFIDFIKPRLNNELTVFEYGSGYSTLFFARYTKAVTSVEHDENWYNELRRRTPVNVEILLREKNLFVKSIEEKNKKYNLIFIDGENRVQCLKESITHLENNGVIILDDSEREEYVEGITFLSANGFKKIDFWGISPGCLYKKATTIFYKNTNCLSL